MTDAAGGETVLSGPAGHAHTHADGTVHWHSHAPEDAGQVTHTHEHPHTHADGTSHVHPQTHEHEHEHGHTAAHVHIPGAQTVSLETAVLAKNDRIAARNRGWFEGRGVVALNLVSSPGAGKTTLLERTIRELGAQIDIAVIEGDQMTANDATRIRAAGARAVQINTGSGCHLEADMIARAVETLELRQGSLLLIENVGNLVCPAMFDLGERMKVAVTSVTEGEDKPLKYPFMFRAAAVVVLNKVDLAPYVDFDRAAWLAHVRSINADAVVIELSAKTGEGIAVWLEFLHAEQAKAG